MNRAKLIGALAAAALSLIVILQNTQTVETRFLFFKVAMPNAILLALALLIGIFMGILFSLIISKNRSQKKK